MSTGGSIGEMSVSGNRAVVQTMWTDDFGRVDSALRYHPPEYSETRTIFVFHLVRRESSGVSQWKFEAPHQFRVATPERAIAYVEQLSGASNDPKIRKNVRRTLAILERLKAR